MDTFKKKKKPKNKCSDVSMDIPELLDEQVLHRQTEDYAITV